MSPRSLSILALALACPLVMPAADAQTATPKQAVAYPTISSISPMKVQVAGTVTIRGRNFLVGKGRNTVVLKRDKGRAVFVKGGSATRTTIKLKIPAKLQKYLGKKNGKITSTRFRVRILAGRFGRSYTPIAKSLTIVVPENGVEAPTTSPAP